MEDSSEESKKQQHNVAKSAFYLPIGKSLWQSLLAILRFVRFKLYAHNPKDSSSATPAAAANGKVSFASGLPPPPKAVDPATSQTSRGFPATSARGSTQRNRVPKPKPSNGGGGQTHLRHK